MQDIPLEFLELNEVLVGEQVETVHPVIIGSGQLVVDDLDVVRLVY